MDDCWIDVGVFDCGFDVFEVGDFGVGVCGIVVGVMYFGLVE